MQDSTLTLDNVLNTFHLTITFLRQHIQELQTFKNGLVFMAKINWYFRCRVVSLNLCKEYLNVAALKIPVSLPINS